ncbi:hypothetical protein IEQ34_000056 [Dendrobium chrysotoxum]|uniref:Uncharacterized protein n=1 Tax=Dendrobium chrysotoxum TaxID=161865 RepID=A0AAV7HRV3_DENCH|nr:hypothetical protein IEQ34_000056 [Dendrobium chrysotoxum]
MVLWEITAATAYFLGLKRTYRIALRLQRRIIGPKHPRIRQFLDRRTRAIFEVAVTVHKNIQQRDLEAGRSLGNWFLRFLDRIKPSAQIRSSPEKLPINTRALNSNKSIGVDKPTDKMSDRIDENRRLFTSFNKNSLPLPTIMMMKPTKQAQNHHFSSHSVQNFSSFLNCRRGQYNDVIRRDIALWMHLK